jgi:hypothetical protein
VVANGAHRGGGPVPGGTWSAPAVLASRFCSSVATAIDGAGNAIAVSRSSHSWHLAEGSWGPASEEISN